MMKHDRKLTTVLDPGPRQGAGGECPACWTFEIAENHNDCRSGVRTKPVAVSNELGPFIRAQASSYLAPTRCEGRLRGEKFAPHKQAYDD